MRYRTVHPSKTVPPGILYGLLFAVLVLVSACGSEPPGIGVAASEVTDNPEQYYDRLVTISGEVDEVYNSHVFTLGGDDFNDDLLVISADPVAVVAGRTEDQPFEKDDIVQVTGLVHPFVMPDLEAQYGLDLAPELEVEFENHPVVVAASATAVFSEVVVTPRSTRATESPLDAIPILSTGDAVAATTPSSLVGQLAIFTDAQIQDVVDENAFWVGPDSTRRVFVVVPDVALEETPRTGQHWTLHGILDELPGETFMETSWNLDAETISALQDHAVYLRAIRAEHTTDA